METKKTAAGWTIGVNVLVAGTGSSVLDPFPSVVVASLRAVDHRCCTPLLDSIKLELLEKEGDTHTPHNAHTHKYRADAKTVRTLNVEVSNVLYISICISNVGVNPGPQLLSMRNLKGSRKLQGMSKASKARARQATSLHVFTTSSLAV